MKKALDTILLVFACAGTVVYAAPHHGGHRGGHHGGHRGDVVQMAKKDSKVSIDALCMAVYEAVKADSSKAVDIFKSVMMQRDTWSATETYSILRSILLAAPSLEQGFVQNAAEYNNQPGSYTPVAVDSMGYQLLSALYTLPQTQPVAATVAQGVAGSTITGSSVGSGITSDSMESYVPNAPSTAPAASPNN